MTSTPVSLLDRLRKGVDHAAWSRFVDLYSPLVFAWARQMGLQPADAADLAQDVFTLLIQKLPEFMYQQGGSFRGWLKTVTLNKWRERCRQAAARHENGQPPPDVADEASAELWEAEFRQQLAGRALALMRQDFAPQTWQACWALAVEGRPAAEVAAQLGVSVGTVYAAKCRVLARLRQELAGMWD
ncbi:MAG: RNA polymerase sigma factor [Pirellulales bacterium]